MSGHFLSSEDYDERAHRLYNEGDYEGALETLKEGLALYPHAVDLYVGLGYARLAREEFAWARQTFERALALDPEHEDALVGMGDALLRFGDSEAAVRLFRRVTAMGFGEDVELLLTMGRALYREGLYTDSRNFFAKAASVRPDNAEAAASLGYALHRLGDETGAARQIRRALRLDPDGFEARVYLGHLLYDRGDWEGALREFERVPPMEHWDPLAVWRLIELKRALWQVEADDPSLQPWERRLRDLEGMEDPIDRLLAEVEQQAATGTAGATPRGQLDLFPRPQGERAQRAQHHVRTADGRAYRGTWQEIIRQMRDQSGFGHETTVQYMRRLAERWHEQANVRIPFHDPEGFFRAAIEAGLVKLEEG